MSEGVTSIGDYAFSNTGLTSVTIPGSVTSIGRQAFSGCTGLTSVTISEGVTSILNEAFEDCDSLTTVTIPGSVTFIGQDAFSGCTGLTSVIFADTESKWYMYAVDEEIGPMSSDAAANATLLKETYVYYNIYNENYVL